MMKLFKKLFHIDRPFRASVLQCDAVRDAEILARDIRMARYPVSNRGARAAGDKIKPPRRH